MYPFFILLLLMVGFKILKPSHGLYDFNRETTLPLRGLLALFIMLHHMSLRYDFSISEALGVGNTLTINLFRTMGMPIVGVFFLLTGYGLAKSLIAKGHNYLSGFIPKRLLSTLPEFLFLTFLFILYKLTSGDTSWEIISSNFSKGYPPLPNSWFIFTITIVYLVFYLSALVARSNIRATGLGLSIGIVLYCFVTCYGLHYGVWWYMTAPAVLCGYYIACHEDKITKILSSQRGLIATIGAILIVVCIIVAFCYVIPNLSPYKFVPILYAIILLSYVNVRLYGMGKSDILIWLGSISLNIYLVHGIYIDIITPKEMNPYLLLIVIIGISITTAWILKAIRGFFK